MIEDIKNEYIEHGDLINSINILDCLLKVKSAIKRHKCSLDEYIISIKLAISDQIINENFNIPIRNL